RIAKRTAAEPPRLHIPSTRNSMVSFLFSGSFLLRFAARRFLASLFHEPPRTYDRTPPGTQTAPSTAPAAAKCRRATHGQSTPEPAVPDLSIQLRAGEVRLQSSHAPPEGLTFPRIQPFIAGEQSQPRN